MDWMQAAENPGHVFVDGTSLLDAQVQVNASAGSIVYLAQAKANVQPYFVSDHVFSFEAEDYLYVEVYSENHDRLTIYAIVVHNRKPGLRDFTLDEKSAMGGRTIEGRPIPSFGSIGEPGNSPDDVATEGEMMFDIAKAGTSLALTLSPEVSTATARAVAVAAGSSPVFSGPFMGVSGGIISGLSVAPVEDGYLYIEVRGDGVYSGISYYKIKMIAKKNDRSIKLAKFVWYDGNTKIGEKVLGVGTMGTHSWSGGEAYGAYNNGAEVVGGSGAGGYPTDPNFVMPTNRSSFVELYDDLSGQRPPANFRLTLELEGNDPDLQFSYDYSKNQRSQPAFLNTTGDFGKLIGFYWIAVEVTSGMGEKGWYKFGSSIGSENTDLGSIKINGTVLPTLPDGNISASDASKGYVTVTVPANTDMNNLAVEVAPPAGYYSRLAVASGLDEYTDVSSVLYNLNEDAHYNSNTGINTTTLDLVSGQFIHIRLLAELSWFYGGSGFVGATWLPARSADQYTAYKYYKVRVVKQGATSDIEINDIKYKGNSIGQVPEPIEVTTTQGTTFETDGKKNVIVTTTTTTSWSDVGTEYQTNDFTDIALTVTPGASTPNLRFAYAVSAANPTTAISAANFNTTGLFGSIDSNSYIVIRATSEDGTNVKYYKIHLLSSVGPDCEPTAIKINGTSIGAIGTGNVAVTGTEYVTYNMPNKGAFDEVTVTVDKPNSSVSVAYVVVGANDLTANIEQTIVDGNPVELNPWTDTEGVFTLVSPAQYLYIRTISADRTQKRYYKVRLMLAGANADAELTAIRINGTAITTVPAPNNSVTGTTFGEYRVASLQNLNNMQVAVDASPGASVAFASSDANNTNMQDWANTTGVFGIFLNANYLYIRVASEDGLTTRFYKVRIAAGSNDAALTDISINGTSIGTLPAPNNAATGTTSVVYHVANAAALTNLAVTVAAPQAASVAYGASAANNTVPANWNNTAGTFASFTAGQWLVIRVSSEDTTVNNYYKVRLVWGSDSTDLTNITVNTQGIGTLPAANNVATGTTAATYSIATPLSTVTVAATSANSATIDYASAAAANTAPGSYAASGSFAGLASGNYVVIRVVSQDLINTVYYKVQVFHGSPDADLEGIRINGTYVVPIPAGNTAVTGTNAEALTVLTTDLASITVKVGVSPGSTVAYGTAATDNVAPANFNNITGVFTDFTAGDYVVVRVISQDGQVTQYYKVQIND